jgi:hypothetical protein
LVFGVAAALLSALILGTAATAAKPATKSCSTAGLRFAYKQEGVTYAVAVAGLKARVASCPQARSLAGTVAKDILHDTKVPTRIAGLTVTVKEPCSGCTPNTRVTARSGQELIAFMVKGGA